MKIGLLNPTILMRRPIAELAGELQQLGHQVTIITPLVRGAGWSPSHFESQQIPILSLPSWEIRRVLWSWPSWLAIVRLWRSVKAFEVIHIWAPYYLVAILPIIFSRLRPRAAKIILTFDTIPGFSFRFDSIFDQLMVVYHRLIGSWLFRFPQARTLYSRLLLPAAQQAWLGKNFTIIPTGIHLPPWVPRPRRSTARLELLFIGILNARKGVGVLLQAAKLLQQEKMEFRLQIVGDGPQRRSFEQQRDDLGLQGVVDFTGRTKQVAEFFARADVFILPSYGEGLPGVVMEAMAYGVPVVASNIPCLPDLIPGHAYGQLIPTSNPPALAAAIRRYAADEAYRQSVITQARQHIETLNWRLITPRYENLYTERI